MKKRSWYLLLLVAVVLPGGCKKYLEKLPNTNVVVPTTIPDYQKLLDNTSIFGLTPVIGEVSADNIYMPAVFWQTLDVPERNAYAWVPDIYEGQTLSDDWDVPYQQVFYANVILEGVAKIGITTANEAQWHGERGSALFLRAYAFWNVAQLFAPVYDSGSAATDLGIPLRLNSDVTQPSVRATVAATYDRITSDLLEARQLLSANVPTQYPNRPSRPAAQAMLARVYLSMRAYDLAGRYADSVLQRYDSLMDYSTLDTTSSFPFSNLNPEVLYQSNVVSYTQCMASLLYPSTLIDSTLYGLYDAGDLRRSLYYVSNGDGTAGLNAGYAELIWPFTGLATDELYLIRAECAARTGQLGQAMADLNTLRSHRYAPGTYTPLTAANRAEAIALVLIERRKELSFRGLRWSDLRRLNKAGAAINLERILSGQVYSLPANDNRYVLPIPPDVLHYNPTMQQNPR